MSAEPLRYPVIRGGDLIMHLAPFLGLNGGRVRRIVLDVRYDSFPLAYVEIVGDTRLLEIDASVLQNVQIRFAPEAEVEG